MDSYKELASLLGKVTHRGGNITILQGIVKSVQDLTCTVEVGSLTLTDVRLCASTSADNGELLIIPKVGSAVIMVSLSGDMTHLVIVAIDCAESIIINGGKLGGLINIDALTSKLNELVQAFNTHTHNMPTPMGLTAPPTKPAVSLKKQDYEDTKIKH